MKKIIKAITISGLATTVAVATNFYIKAEKRECLNTSQNINTLYNQTSNLKSSDFKLNLSTTGKNIEIKEDLLNKLADAKETVTDKLDEVKDNIPLPQTLEATKEDNIIPIDDNLTPATYLMNNETIETDNDINEQSNDNSLVIDNENDDKIIEDTELNVLPSRQTETDNQEQENDTDETYDTEIYDIELTLSSLEQINENLTKNIEEINSLLDKIDIDEINEEQKQNLTSHINFINQKSYDLMTISKDLLCEINGNCSSQETIESLSYRLNSLQNAIRSIQLLNNHIASNYKFYSNPQANIYGYSYSFYPNFENEEENNQDNNLEITNETTKNDENNQTINNLSNEDSLETSSENNSTKKLSKKNIDSYNKRYFTSNIDTYGPKRRNLDSFYNTALLDEYGYGYNMPYYNNMAGANFAGNYAPNFAGPNFNNNFNNDRFNNLSGLTSNDGYYNPEYNHSKTNEKEVSQENLNIENSSSQTTPISPEKVNPKRVKFAKNIDTYQDKTMNANINSMNGKKITEFIKSKFNKWFRKDKTANEEINNYVDNFIAENSKDNNTSDNLENKNLNEIVSANAKPHRTKDIKDSYLINNTNLDDLEYKQDPLTY